MMKTTNKCPKCESEKIFHQSKVATAGGFFGNRSLALESKETKTVGEFSVYICKDCGYSEFWLGKDGMEYLKSK